MGLFADELKRAMDEKSIKQSDFPKGAEGRVSQSQINAFLKGTIPQSAETIDKIARVLGKPAQEFRKYAALDLIERLLKRYKVKSDDIFRVVEKAEIRKYKLPIFPLKDLSKYLSNRGYPVKEPPSDIEVALDYGSYSYGLEIEPSNSTLSPRVLPGEIAILSGKYKKGPLYDYGLVGIVKGKELKIYTGRIITHKEYFIVEAAYPYSTEHIRRKDVAFFHRIVSILRKEPFGS